MSKTVLALVALLGVAPVWRPAAAQEIIITAGPDSAVEYLESIGWWGEALRGEQLNVPRALVAGVSAAWRENAQNIPVPVKKELFYRTILPLVVHANQMVLDRRGRLERLDAEMAGGAYPQDEDLLWLRFIAVLLRIVPSEDAEALDTIDEWREVVREALHRLDVVPAGLALGQAAYESGYGTSRFAVEGNALFGQWTFGAEGLKPEQQRGHLGDHRIASFDWPFDSVRAYFINLSAHPAYEDFRRIRAELKAAGRPLDSLVLADGLVNYSERGQAYVDDLKGIIRANQLDVADHAVPRDEPLRFVLGAGNEEDAARLREKIEQMRASGEIDQIIQRMRLE